jgi:2-iminoacetate synthase ThiH
LCKLKQKENKRIKARKENKRKERKTEKQEKRKTGRKVYIYFIRSFIINISLFCRACPFCAFYWYTHGVKPSAKW